ncbi:MAG: gp436 family protein [Thermodesulfobacteriota bacterium]
MAYCSEDDLLKMITQSELAELTVESGEVPDSLIIEDAIGKADAEINSFLGVKYVVPLSPPPDQVRALSVDLAIYNLYSRRNVVPQVRQQRYEAAVALLKQVASGELVIMGLDGEAATAAKNVADATSAVRCFSRNTLTDW